MVGVRPHIRERDPGRFLHHVAELSGEHEPVLALHRRRLDEEDVAARAGHREAGRDAWHRRALRRLLVEPLAAERLAHELEVDRDRRLELVGDDTSGGFPQQLAELTLELAYAGLARVLAPRLTPAP